MDRPASNVVIRRRAGRWHALLGLVLCASAGDLVAQTVQPPARPRTDSIRPAAKPLPPSAIAARARFMAPLTPRRAFIYSAMLPGLGQSRLDRGSAGILFASVELAAIVMVRRSAADWREAKRFQLDSLPADFTIGTDRKATPSGSIVGRYDADLVRTRRLHLEDWLAVVAFNHLIAGAEAFVSAQLWDSPVQLSATPGRRGLSLSAAILF